MAAKNARFVGLPSTPRAKRETVTTVVTVMEDDLHSAASSFTLVNEKPRQMFVDTRPRNHDSIMFANATIPVSPTDSDCSDAQDAMNGLQPRPRNGFARLFCCFGREARARRRYERENYYEPAGKKLHWSEY